ncbi:hypothetical protein [Corallococcus llansteffanensis]|uniref:Uncharacterized protein n=1 Tax=Corallococcus llansteffanensis TaxID=2316731 RepID=A0A3A8QI89_9BACT|nr:hypothetical protein [Corallococcus llansteffanensis]RKH68423.1 hypothetical protein D7V93_01420 [Corallococcus llansteffanensis]
MKTSHSFALIALSCAVFGLAGCGTDSASEPSPDTAISHEGTTGLVDPSTVNMDELVPVETESGTVTASACTNYSTRYVQNGCCTQTATKFQQQICIYGAWYWQTPYKCEYPTSYCLP